MIPITTLVTTLTARRAICTESTERCWSANEYMA